MEPVCVTLHNNIFLAFYHSPAWFSSTVAIIVALASAFIGVLTARGALKFWWNASVDELKSRRLLLLIMAIEASLLISAWGPYVSFGTHDEKVGYITFALPCLAALTAGAGLASSNKRIDPNGWAYIVSALLLLVAFVVFVYQPTFADKIAFLSLPVLIGDALAALLLMNHDRRNKFNLTNLYLPFVKALGLVGALLGLCFYFIVIKNCPTH
jgi:hypothetical protein